jgi:hypothetical protein
MYGRFCCNITGLNYDDKQLSLKEKLNECGCVLACIQVTKETIF